MSSLERGVNSVNGTRSRRFLTLRGWVDYATGATRPRGLACKEGIEQWRKIAVDVFDLYLDSMYERIAVLAVPLETVELAGLSPVLNN